MWRLRKSVRKRIRWGVLIAGCQLCLLYLCQFAVRQETEKRYEMVLTEKELRLEAAGRMVYVTKDAVRAGEKLSEENIEERYVLYEQSVDLLKVDITDAVACVDLPAGMILNTSVCKKKEYGVTDRECTFQGIGYVECFDVYDAVDVRIRYGNGENYCVLKEKRLLPADNEGECCFVLSEEEQLMMSGARFDAEMYDGAELYLVGITNEWEEDVQLSMFLPSKQVLLQLQKLDENGEEYVERIGEQRSALEQRLQEHRKKRDDGLL